MGIKFLENKNCYQVGVFKRHPVTKQPVAIIRQADSKSEAVRLEKQLWVELDRKLRATIIPSWAECIDKTIAAFRNRGITEKTIESYHLCLNAHTREVWGDRRVDEIQTEEIRELIQVRLGHRSLSHQKNLLKFIRSVFEYSLDAGYVNRNPAPKMKFKIGNKIKMVLNREQVRVFLEKAKACDSEWYPIWATAIYTGMRNGELYALTWDKVDFEKRQILVDCAWNNKDGFKETKSGEDRIVEIAPNLLSMLKELKIANYDSNFVLPRAYNWEKGEQARWLRHFLIGIGLPAIRFHDLRATWATIMLSKGVEAIKVMNMGGWKDIKTMQYYIRKAGVDIRGITDTLDLHDPHQKIAEILDFKL